jgi:limonene-1,2-epoxide hydrolase
VPDAFDPAAMIERFRARATAVRNRGIPPIEGPERQRFIDQAQVDFMDYAMLGDAEATLAEGILTLRIDLRPDGADGSGS